MNHKLNKKLTELKLKIDELRLNIIVEKQIFDFLTKQAIAVDGVTVELADKLYSRKDEVERNILTMRKELAHKKDHRYTIEVELGISNSPIIVDISEEMKVGFTHAIKDVVIPATVEEDNAPMLKEDNAPMVKEDNAPMLKDVVVDNAPMVKEDNAPMLKDVVVDNSIVPK